MTKVEEYINKLHCFALDKDPSDSCYSDLDKLWFNLTSEEQLKVELELSKVPQVIEYPNMVDIELKIGDKKPPRVMK